MTIGDQSMPMFHDDVTHGVHLAMGSIGRPCSTIQGSMLYLSLTTVQALREVSVCDDTRPFYLVAPDQQPMQSCSSFDQAILLLPCWTNNHYPRPGLNVVIKPYKLALLPTASIDKAFLVIGMQFSIGKMIKRRQNSITLYPIDRIGYHFRNQWA